MALGCSLEWGLHRSLNLPPVDAIAGDTILWMQYTLRLVREDDIYWLFELNKESYFDVVVRQFGEWNETIQREMFFAKWQLDLPAHIIEMEGERIGVVVLEQREDYDWLREIQIKSYYQGHGIGSDILSRFLEQSRSTKRPLRLKVLHENHRAKHLYERVGFIEIERLENHYLMEIE